MKMFLFNNTQSMCELNQKIDINYIYNYIKNCTKNIDLNRFYNFSYNYIKNIDWNYYFNFATENKESIFFSFQILIFMYIFRCISANKVSSILNNRLSYIEYNLQKFKLEKEDYNTDTNINIQNCLKSINEFEKKLTTINKNITSIKRDITNIKKDIKDVDENIENFEFNIDAIEKKVNRLERHIKVSQKKSILSCPTSEKEEYLEIVNSDEDEYDDDDEDYIDDEDDEDYTDDDL